MPFSEKLFISVETQQFYWNCLFSWIHLQPWTFFFLNCNLYVMWLATINLMRPWGIVYKMKKKKFTLVLIGSARRLAHRIFFFLHRIFFFTAVSFEIMSYCFFQKLELTADEQNRHPGELSRATFEVSLWGLGKILAWWSNKHSGSCLCLSPLIFWNKSNNHKICKLTELYKRKCIALEQWGDKSQILKFLLVLNA